MAELDIKKELLESVYKNVNVPALCNDALDKVLEPVLKKLVADSSNKLDDVLMAALYPLLESELKKVIKEQWDLLISSPKPGDILGAPV